MTRRAIHIVHGVLSLDVGGLERLVVSLVGAGRKRGNRVSVICVERPGKLVTEAEYEGATVISLDKPPGRHTEFIERSLTVFANLQPDIVHTHQIGAAWYLGPAAKQLGRSVIHTEHGNHFSKAGSLIRTLKTQLLYRSSARYIDQFCCVSDEIAAAATRWRTIPRAKVEVVLNGISGENPTGFLSPESTRAALGIPATAPVIGTVGRLVEVKWQAVLIRAFQQVRQTHLGAHLILVGDGSERSNLEALTRELGVVESVHFLGYQNDPEQYFGIMDVFALTSRSEGFPISMLEAWRAGVATVSSSVGGIPKIVSEGVNALMVPSGDVHATAEAIRRILNDTELKGRLGTAGQREMREHYTLDRMASEYENIYRKFITRSEAGR